MRIWNTFKTTILLAGLTALFIVIGGALGGQVGMIIALIIAMAMNMGAWWFSDKLALRMSGAREVSPAEAPELHEMVEVLSQRAAFPGRASTLSRPRRPTPLPRVATLPMARWQ